MDSIDNALLEESVSFRNVRFSGIRNVMDRIRLTFSQRTQKKELKQFEDALNEITSTFLNRYGYKYGYVRPGILSDINLEVLNRLKNKSKSKMDDFKPRVTAKGLIYFLIYQTCLSLMNSHSTIHAPGDNPHTESLLDLIQFCLNGLNHEKIKGLSGD